MGNLKNFATSLVVTGPSPATSGTTMFIEAGKGYRYPLPPFYGTAHPAQQVPTLDNAEVLQVTAQGRTTIAVGSNGASLPQGTINLVDATSLPSSGTIGILTSNGYQAVTYTGKTSTTITGATGGTGSMTTGNAAVSDQFTFVRTQKETTTARSIDNTFRFSNTIFTEDMFNGTAVENEPAGGTPNGVLTTFTIASAGKVTGTLKVYKNGIRLKNGGNDFTETSTGFTMVTAPATGTVLLVDYRVGGGSDYSVGTNSSINDETPVGTVNGSTTLFTTVRPYIAGSLQVFINGYKQKNGVHFTETNNLLGTFTMSDAPLTGDDIMVLYDFNLNPSSNADTTDGAHASITPIAGMIPVTDASNVALSNTYRNLIINGAMRIAQRSTVQSLSTTSQYGTVDRFRVHATGTAVSAGTIIQDTTLAIGSTGYSLKVAGATITGTGVVIMRQRIESLNARSLVNKIASFSALVYQDTGGAINYTIIIRKPTTTADDFSATTTVATSSTISVNTSAATTIAFQNVAMGDVTKGIEIEIQAACGAVTTKNFYMTDVQLNRGQIALTFLPDTYRYDLAECQRYYYAPIEVSTAVFGVAPVYVSGGTSTAIFSLPVQMRASPTITLTNGVTRYGGADFSWSGTPIVGFFFGAMLSVQGTSTGTANGNSAILYINGAGVIRFEAEI